MSNATQKKVFKVNVRPSDRKRLDRIAKNTRRKHIDVIGIALEALEREEVRQGTDRNAVNAAA